MQELEADADGQRSADKAPQQRKRKVHRADVLVIGRIHEAPPSGWMTVIAMIMVVRRIVCPVSCRRCSHCQFLPVLAPAPKAASANRSASGWLIHSRPRPRSASRDRRPPSSIQDG